MHHSDVNQLHHSQMCLSEGTLTSYSQMLMLAESLSKDPYGDKTPPYISLWNADPVVVASMTPSQFDVAKAILAGSNHHREALLAHCKWCGSPEQIDEAASILRRQSQIGHLTPELDRRIQTLESAIKPLDARKRSVCADSLFGSETLKLEAEVTSKLRESGWTGTRFGQAADGYGHYIAKFGDIQGTFIGLWHREQHSGCIARFSVSLPAGDIVASILKLVGPEQFQVAPVQTTPDQLRFQIENAIACLRRVIDAPVELRYGECVSIQVMPLIGDDRVVVNHSDMGMTTVNYTTEGLILDVHAQDKYEDSVVTLALDRDDLSTVN